MTFKKSNSGEFIAEVEQKVPQRGKFNWRLTEYQSRWSLRKQEQKTFQVIEIQTQV